MHDRTTQEPIREKPRWLWQVLAWLPVILFAVGLAGPARAESLVTSLSSHRVAITSNYTGASVALFGAIERDAQTVARSGSYDVVVTVLGPRQNMVVREKDTVGPVWINREQQRFPEAPAYIGVFASGPLAEVTTDALRRRLRIGIDAIAASPEFGGMRGPEGDAFREALVRLKRAERLYVEVDRGVTFLTPSIFRSAITLPATAPPGHYEVNVALFADGVMLSREQTGFELVKIGFEQRVGELARDQPLLYGGATALVALMFGWLASVIFRRD